MEKYLAPEDTYLTIVFGELEDGKVKQKGTFAKMARVKWCAIWRRIMCRAGGDQRV